MVAVSASTVSDVKLVASTGKARGEWHALLDAENAATWEHPDIARWLTKEHGVDGWWAQGITIGYEQARGLRVPGQQPDGTFAAGSSKTLEGTPPEVLERVIALFSDHLGFEPVSVSRAVGHPTARWALPDGTSVLATVSPAPLGTVHKARVAMTRLKLPDAEMLAEAKDELAAVLARLEA